MNKVRPSAFNDPNIFIVGIVCDVFNAKKRNF